MRVMTANRTALLALVAVMLLGGVAGAAAPTFTSAGIATGPSNQSDPEIDADLVVWTAGNMLEPTTRDIVFRELKTGSHTTLAYDDGQSAPDVSEGRVVYQDDWGGNSDIMARDIPDGSNSWGVANSDDDEVGPRVDGAVIVWLNATTENLQYRDAVSGVQNVPGGANVTEYDVDNGRIVWVDGNAATPRVHVWMPGLTGASVDDVFNVPAGTEIRSLRLHGDRLAMGFFDGNDMDVLVIDITSELPIANPDPDSDFDESSPAVFWHGYAYQTDHLGDWDITFNRGSDYANVAAAPGFDESDPSIFGRRIVYARESVLPGWDIWMAAAPPESHRSAGANRYATAVAVSQQYFASAYSVVLCTGANFPDALSATPLARAVQGPLLLTRKDYVDAATMAEIARLNVKMVYLIGGADVVSDAVRKQLEDASYATTRIQGSDRYATSAAIARKLDTVYTAGVNRAFFARADDFPDALAVGPVAACGRAPILLVPTNSVPSAIDSVMRDLDIARGTIVGGSGVVSDGVKNSLKAIMLSYGVPEEFAWVDRWSGANRYETAAAVVEGGLKERWIDLDTLGFATGLNFPDALGGGAAMGYSGSALLLTSPTSVPGAVTTFLTVHEYEVGRMDVFGGSDVVSDAVKNAIAAKLK